MLINARFCHIWSNGLISGHISADVGIKLNISQKGRFFWSELYLEKAE